MRWFAAVWLIWLAGGAARLWAVQPTSLQDEAVEETPDDGPRLPPGKPELWFQGSKTLFKFWRTDHSLIGVARARGPFTDWYDLRAGILSRVKFDERLYVRIGYLARGFDSRGTGHRLEHRFFVGPIFDLSWDRPHARYIGLYERFIGRPGTSDFNRHRHRFDVEWRRLGLTPFVYEELFLLGGELIRSRTRIGLRSKISTGRRIDYGYQFEWMKIGGQWGPRHVLVVIYSKGVPIDDY